MFSVVEMRAFIGIGLSDEAKAALTQSQQELATSHADVKWVQPEQLHVTLKFLDEISDAQRQQMEASLTTIAQQTSAFTMGLQAIGAFPSVSDPRIIWVGVGEGKASVVRLAEAIEQGARVLGLKREERPYSAHVTIGRVRSGRNLQSLTQQLKEAHWQAPVVWQATSLTFYQSLLGSGGPTYSVLEEIPLGVSP